jgi:hypothetical protein
MDDLSFTPTSVDPRRFAGPPDAIAHGAHRVAAGHGDRARVDEAVPLYGAVEPAGKATCHRR